jgi:hypothetical protein
MVGFGRVKTFSVRGDLGLLRKFGRILNNSNCFLMDDMGITTYININGALTVIWILMCHLFNSAVSTSYSYHAFSLF